MRLRPRIVDLFQPGEMQSERDHKLESHESSPGEFNAKKFRHAFNGGWFSFELKVDPSVKNDLSLTFWGSDNRRAFDVLVDDQLLVHQKLVGRPANQFFETVVPIPAEMIKGKKTIRVKVVAPKDGWAGGLFGVRVLRG